NDCAYKSLQSSGVKQLCNVNQLFLIRFNDKECILNAPVSDTFSVRGDCYHAAVGLQHGPGSFEGLAAHTVEHDVDILDMVFEARRFVINHLIRSELFHEVRVIRGSRADDVSSVKPRQLDCEQTHRTGSPVNQDTFTRLQPGPIQKALPRRQGPYRYSRGKFM